MGQLLRPLKQNKMHQLQSSKLCSVQELHEPKEQDEAPDLNSSKDFKGKKGKFVNAYGAVIQDDRKTMRVSQKMSNHQANLNALRGKSNTRSSNRTNYKDRIKEDQDGKVTMRVRKLNNHMNTFFRP